MPDPKYKHFAVRYYPSVSRFYQRKKAKPHTIVASKAVAHKLARTCYYVMRDQVQFDPQKAFAGQDRLGAGRGNPQKVLAFNPPFLLGSPFCPPFFGLQSEAT